MRWIPIVTIVFLFGCQSSASDYIPLHVQAAVAKAFEGKEPCVVGIEQPIEWEEQVAVLDDTTWFFFDISCDISRKRRVMMPQDYKVVVVEDSVVDILKYWNLFGGWRSILPKVFQPKEQKWWSEPTDYDMVVAITAEKRKVLELEGEEGRWGEWYMGEVEIQMGNKTLSCDSVLWNPREISLTVPGDGVMISIDSSEGKTTTLTGSDWLLDVDKDAYIVNNAKGIIDSFEK